MAWEEAGWDIDIQCESLCTYLRETFGWEVEVQDWSGAPAALEGAQGGDDAGLARVSVYPLRFLLCLGPRTGLHAMSIPCFHASFHAMPSCLGCFHALRSLGHTREHFTDFGMSTSSMCRSHGISLVCPLGSYAHLAFTPHAHAAGSSVVTGA
jgi:hypothetical protein